MMKKDKKKKCRSKKNAGIKRAERESAHPSRFTTLLLIRMPGQCVRDKKEASVVQGTRRKIAKN